MTLSLSDLVCLSEKRRAILLLLGKKDYSIDELTEEMDMTPHSLMPQLKTLRDGGIISAAGGLYELTPIGRVLVKNMYPVFETINVLEKDQRYWFDRNLSVIPPELTERIREIGDYKLLDYDLSNYMFDVPREFCDLFNKSKYAMCLLSIYHPIYSEM
ncbi:MAG: ArsR family transcriptional regulator [Methanimicrococcus sp.]|nr:ArsR family transcriptional regulator [Methanimicrococcus sp.]